MIFLLLVIFADDALFGMAARASRWAESGLTINKKTSPSPQRTTTQGSIDAKPAPSKTKPAPRGPALAATCRRVKSSGKRNIPNAANKQRLLPARIKPIAIAIIGFCP